MLGDHPRCAAVWSEPGLGDMLGTAREMSGGLGRGLPNFVLGEPAEARTAAVRGLVEGALRARYSSLLSDELLLIKDQNGSVGAGLLMEAFPRSAMILLVRDPRDVLSSAKDALARGGWGRDSLRLTAVRHDIFDADYWAERWAASVAAAAAAYDGHRGPRALVRYRDLRSDTLGELTRVAAAVGWEMPGPRLERIVRRYSFERVPEEQRGPGRFHRRAEPGSWREDLEPEQARRIEELTEPLLDRFFPEWRREPSVHNRPGS